MNPVVGYFSGKMIRPQIELRKWLVYKMINNKLNTEKQEGLRCSRIARRKDDGGMTS